MSSVAMRTSSKQVDGQAPDSRLVSLSLCAMALALTVTFCTKLQLFKDGSGYLLEMLVAHPAVRHYRFSALLIQAPAAVGDSLIMLAGVAQDIRVQFTSLLFCAAYAMVPMGALAASWLTVRATNPALFVWPASVILVLNSVNFSWVSELLIAVQVSCPLMLAAYVNPNSSAFKLCSLGLIPFVFFLHPLSFLIFLAIGIGVLQTRSADPEDRLRRVALSALLIGLAFARAVSALQLATPYERELLSPAESGRYLFSANFETLVFLAAALWSTWRVAWPDPLARWQTILQRASVAVVTVIAFAAGTNMQSALGWDAGALPVGLSALALASSRARFFRGELGHLHILAWSFVLVCSSYFVGPDEFPLKTGLVLFAALAVFIAAARDARERPRPTQMRSRRPFLISAVTVFVLSALIKSTIWWAAIERLQGTLSARAAECVEIGSGEYDWLWERPYRIIANWSLPSLALVGWAEEPRPLLLESGECDAFFEAGEIQVDPWTVLERENLPFIFGENNHS